jgi:hypothetical protein
MAMLKLYQHGFGSSFFTVPKKPPVLAPEVWAPIRQSAIQLMSARNQESAATILRDQDFQIYEGENDWKDDFNVLYRKLTLDEYIIFAAPDPSNRLEEACRQIAQTLAELGHPVRFVGAEYVPDLSPQPVAPPAPKNTSTAVQEALADAEQLVSQNRPVSAVDRAHTSLHGYLKQLLSEAHVVTASQDPTVVECVKALLKQHPTFQAAGPHQAEAEKIARGFASILDAFSPIRNQGSLAHANETLIEAAEAMLVINASRTILHYMHRKAEC